MTTEKLKLGGIYITDWDKRQFRVIGFDDIEVFYDCFWAHDNSWSFSGNFKKSCFFYRTSSLLFIAKSKLLDYVPLTIEEQHIFRPDLPIRLGRTWKYDWNSFGVDNFDSFIRETEGLPNKYFLEQKLPTDRIVLIPFGNNDGAKKGTIIIADNLSYFGCSELIWKAKEIQEKVNTKISKGIGIYRIGFEKGIPSYYIGEYIDKAGILSK